MLDAELKSKIKKLWNKFWSGGIANNRTPECIIELKCDFEKKFDFKDTKRALLKLVEYNEAKKDVLVYGLLLFHPTTRPYRFPIFRKALKRQYKHTMIALRLILSLFLLCDETREV